MLRAHRRLRTTLCLSTPLCPASGFTACILIRGFLGFTPPSAPAPQALDTEAGRAASGQEAVTVQLISPTGAAATVPVELADAGTRFR